MGPSSCKHLKVYHHQEQGKREASLYVHSSYWSHVAMVAETLYCEDLVP